MFTYTSLSKEGWTCPRCSRVYAPWAPQCDWCNHQVNQTIGPMSPAHECQFTVYTTAGRRCVICNSLESPQSGTGMKPLNG